MNIFVLDRNTQLCAQYHCDKHVVKMILESAQILSTVNRLTGLNEGYKATHANHPCVIWATEGIDNWLWLKSLALELAEEWRFRYNHVREHKSETLIKTLSIPALPDYGTNFKLCMPLSFCTFDVVESYRNYYKQDKAHLLTYTKREQPTWLSI